MKPFEDRHYNEPEVLLHLLGEEDLESAGVIAAHLETCRVCATVASELEDLRGQIQSWSVPAVSEETWQTRKLQLLARFRHDHEELQKKGLLYNLQRKAEALWDYALNNPLPTLGYIAAAVAFASERTITVFRLHPILPAPSEVIDLLSQVL